jgi:cephalosporin hydroxylase
MSFVSFVSTAACQIYNNLNNLRSSRPVPQGAPPEVQEIVQRASLRYTDISDHLLTLFAETVSVHPRLIVELGVRGGESTFAFERAARLSGAHVLSVDLEDCLVQSPYPKWTFVKQNDITFAGEFPQWCSSHQLSPEIDVLFIDTSHLYEHTLEELRFWMPYLAARSKMILHDTNMKRVYRRADRSLGMGWDNDRGVIRALEETLGVKFNETQDFVTVSGGWLIRHWAHCNGLTVLEKL